MHTAHVAATAACPETKPRPVPAPSRTSIDGRNSSGRPRWNSSLTALARNRDAPSPARSVTVARITVAREGEDHGHGEERGPPRAQLHHRPQHGDTGVRHLGEPVGDPQLPRRWPVGPGDDSRGEEADEGDDDEAPGVAQARCRVIGCGPRCIALRSIAGR